MRRETSYRMASWAPNAARRQERRRTARSMHRSRDRAGRHASRTHCSHSGAHREGCLRDGVLVDLDDHVRERPWYAPMRRTPTWRLPLGRRVARSRPSSAPRDCGATGAARGGSPAEAPVAPVRGAPCTVAGSRGCIHLGHREVVGPDGFTRVVTLRAHREARSDLTANPPAIRPAARRDHGAVTRTSPACRRCPRGTRRGRRRSGSGRG